jgi:transposase-like protein
MNIIKNRYFCPICQASFKNSNAFFVDRQKHISKGDTKEKDGKSKTITK